MKLYSTSQGRMQDFKLGGAHLKKLRRAEGGAQIFWVFRVKNHDFTQKNHIFSNFSGGARRVHTPLDPPLLVNVQYKTGSRCEDLILIRLINKYVMHKYHSN